jgi:hypothetical protein
MQNYLFLVGLILFINSIPAFAPPTWAILIFFMINFDLNPVLLVILGVLSATTGRAFLAWYFRKFAHLVPKKFAKNMDYAGRYVESGSLKKYTLLGLFLISPISSAQLFEAAGLMKSIRIKPLLAAFAFGRTISYSTYLTGANFVSDSSIGELLMRELKSPWAIGSQIVMILGLVGLGQINWSKRIQGHSSHYSPK